MSRLPARGHEESHDMQRFRAKWTQSTEPETLDGADEAIARAKRAAAAKPPLPSKPRGTSGLPGSWHEESHDMQRFRAKWTQSTEPETLDGAEGSIAPAKRAHASSDA